MNSPLGGIFEVRDLLPREPCPQARIAGLRGDRDLVMSRKEFGRWRELATQNGNIAHNSRGNRG